MVERDAVLPQQKSRSSVNNSPTAKVRRFGRPSATIFHQTWRSHFSKAVGFWISLIISIWLSRTMPWSIIKGSMLEWGTHELTLGLPLFWLIPVCAFIIPAFKIYNINYTISLRGLEVKTGILWTSQDINKVAFEDILSVESKQTLIERFLNIGRLEVGTSATDEIEIVFEGVSNPQRLKKRIALERDRAQGKSSQKT